MMKKEWKLNPLLLLIIQGLLLASISGMAQKNDVNNNLNDSCLLQSFTIRHVEGNTYINWTVISNISDYYFTLERSIDENSYDIVDIKKGFFSPKGQPLLYCYIDSVGSSLEKAEYRLRAFKMHYEIQDNERVQIFYYSEPSIFEKNLGAEIKITPLFSFFMTEELRILSMDN